MFRLPQVQYPALAFDDSVYKFFGRNTGGPCLFLDFLAVLVGARKEHDI
jgi:hypothetical protein